jgi:hypothetical protein
MKEEIKTLYLEGLSAREIKEMLGLTVSLRMIQRYIKKMGIMRDPSEAHLAAIKRGNVPYYKYKVKDPRKFLMPTLRFAILEKFDRKCVICGWGAKDGVRLDIDHIDEDPSNNDPENLQVLCILCNRGKSRFVATDIYNDGKKYREIAKKE